ncbi:MAG: YceI family protein, partial [Pseudonocardiaceae bacterium]
MARYLVVCPQTIESQQLAAWIQERAAQGMSMFHLLIPASHPAWTWTWTESSDQAQAQARLDGAVARYSADGFEVSGEVGDPNPVEAVGDVLRREPDAFDEVILCTPPLGLSRRLAQDLSHRIERISSLPVTHLVAASTRLYRGHEIPESGTYEIDRVHSTVEFVARFLTITKVRGRFTDFSGTFEVAEIPEQSSVSITIDAASIRTDDARRDQHLRGPDFLDVEGFPALAFQSTAVAASGEGTWRITGDLSARGVTRPVDLEVEFGGVVVSATGEQRAGFSATTHIDRDAWGLVW